MPLTGKLLTDTSKLVFKDVEYPSKTFPRLNSIQRIIEDQVDEEEIVKLFDSCIVAPHILIVHDPQFKIPYETFCCNPDFFQKTEMSINENKSILKDRQSDLLKKCIPCVVIYCLNMEFHEHQISEKRPTMKFSDSSDSDDSSENGIYATKKESNNKWYAFTIKDEERFAKIEEHRKIEVAEELIRSHFLRLPSDLEKRVFHCGHGRCLPDSVSRYFEKNVLRHSLTVCNDRELSWTMAIEEAQSFIPRSSQEIDRILRDAHDIIRGIARNFSFEDHRSTQHIPNLQACSPNDAKKCKKVLLNAIANQFKEQIARNLHEIRSEVNRTILQFFSKHITLKLQEDLVNMEFGIGHHVVEILMTFVTFIYDKVVTFINIVTFNFLFSENVNAYAWRDKVADLFSEQVDDNKHRLKEEIMREVCTFSEKQVLALAENKEKEMEPLNRLRSELKTLKNELHDIIPLDMQFLCQRSTKIDRVAVFENRLKIMVSVNVLANIREKDEILKMVKKYSGQFTVDHDSFMVSYNRMIPMARQGSKICVDPQVGRYGTLAGFGRISMGNVVGLTNDHVVKPYHTVFDERDTRLGSARDYNITERDLMDGGIMDFSAFEIDENALQRCEKYIFNQYDVKRPVKIYDGNFQQLQGRLMYMYTANSQARKEFKYIGQSVGGEGRYVEEIQCTDDSVQSLLFQEGDSGSLVCFEETIRGTLYVNAVFIFIGILGDYKRGYCCRVSECRRFLKDFRYGAILQILSIPDRHILSPRLHVQ